MGDRSKCFCREDVAQARAAQGTDQRLGCIRWKDMWCFATFCQAEVNTLRMSSMKIRRDVVYNPTLNNVQNILNDIVRSKSTNDVATIQTFTIMFRVRFENYF